MEGSPEQQVDARRPPSGRIYAVLCDGLKAAVRGGALTMRSGDADRALAADVCRPPLTPDAAAALRRLPPIRRPDRFTPWLERGLVCGDVPLADGAFAEARPKWVDLWLPATWPDTVNAAAEGMTWAAAGRIDGIDVAEWRVRSMRVVDGWSVVRLARAGSPPEPS